MMKKNLFLSLFFYFISNNSFAGTICEPENVRPLIGNGINYTMFLREDGYFESEWDTIQGTGDYETHLPFKKIASTKGQKFKNADDEIITISDEMTKCPEDLLISKQEPKTLCQLGSISGYLPTYVTGLFRDRQSDPVKIICKTSKAFDSLYSFTVHR